MTAAYIRSQYLRSNRGQRLRGDPEVRAEEGREGSLSNSGHACWTQQPQGSPGGSSQTGGSLSFSWWD